MTKRLPILLEKAALDAGFDLLVARDDGWTGAGVSGHPTGLLIKPAGPGALLAVEDAELVRRLGLRAADGESASGHGAVAQVDSATALHGVLRQLHVLQIRPAAKLSAEVEARLAAIPETERTQEVRQRIGQDVFREALLELWSGRCALSQVALPTCLLRASHAIPWAVASDSERLDPFNGLLLAVHYDTLFDKGLITFTNEGQVLIHPELSEQAREVLRISGDMRASGLSPGHHPYLSFHRQQVARIQDWGSKVT